jgi:magnesium transporter
MEGRIRVMTQLSNQPFCGFAGTGGTGGVCWMHLQSAEPAAVGSIAGGASVPKEYFTDPLDPDERARFEMDGQTTLIIARIPVQNAAEDSVPFSTLPLGIVFRRDLFVTVCARSAEALQPLVVGSAEKFASDSCESRVLRILLRTALAYLKALKQINAKVNRLENELEKSVRNQELVKLMDLEKSLVFFTTSLRSNELMLERLKSTRLIKENADYAELFDDVVVEMRQAVAMAEIYSNILSGMMDAFASIISNNLNAVMKFLTSVTIILMLPTLVVSVYGMNLPLPFQQSHHSFLIVISLSVMLAVLGAVVFVKRKLF